MVSAPRDRRAGSDSPVNAEVSTKAVSDATLPSTGTTSPCRISSRSPGAMSSSGTSSRLPFWCRVAVRGTRDKRSCISRRARPLAKLSRKVPPEYITATTAAASISPNVRAAVIESAATMSSPTSPRHRLRRISTSNAAHTGRTPTNQAMLAASARPATYKASPARRPPAATSRSAVFSLSVLTSSIRLICSHPRRQLTEHWKTGVQFRHSGYRLHYRVRERGRRARVCVQGLRLPPLQEP